MVNFTLRQCAYFRAVAGAGGIAQAARQLNISQPAVSQAIDKLEQMTGLVLFERHHAKGMELTGQGRAFLERAVRLLSLAEEIARDVDDIALSHMGTIRLGCFQSIAPFHAARLARQYGENAPKVRLEIAEKLQAELIADLEEGELDLAILYEIGLQPSRLHWQQLSAHRPYILLPAGHEKSGEGAISLKDLADMPFVLFDAPASREYFYAIFAAHGLEPRVAFRSTSLESVRSAVGNGLGFSLLAMRPQGEGTYDGGRVAALEIEEAVSPLPIVLAYRPDAVENRLLARFMAFCREEFRG